jgi:alpha-L-fucosidase
MAPSPTIAAVLLVVALLLAGLVAPAAGSYVSAVAATAHEHGHPKDQQQQLHVSLQRAPLALPHPHQLHFQSQEIGCFFHFGMNTFTGQEHGPGGSKQPASKFTAPVNTSTDQWVRTCKSLGGSYAVFTAKHEEGFMNFVTSATDYSIGNTPFCAARKAAGLGCDLVSDFLKSCDKYGLDRGLYFTSFDGDCKTHAPPIHDCDGMLREAFTDLVTKYGPIQQWWFDHGDGLFIDLILKHQPDAVILGREWDLVGTEGGFVRYGLPQWYPAFTKPVVSGGLHPAVNYSGFSGAAKSTSGSPYAPQWRARQCDTSLASSGWFWHEGASPRRNASDAADTYYMQCVGMGAGLIINLPPSTRGLVEPGFVSWAADFRREINRRYGHPVGSTNGSVPTADDGSEPRPGLVLELSGCQHVDTVIMREDLSLGQRVASWIVEYVPCGTKPDRWGTVEYTELGSGSTIGTKRVFPFVYGAEPVTVAVSKIRLRPTLSVAADGLAHIAELSAHMANWTNTSRGAPPTPSVTCFAYQG